MLELINNTPIESAIYNGRRIYIKRDDLVGSFPLPNLGKLRGLSSLLERYNSEGINLVGCFDTGISKLGQGVAALCTRYPNLKALISYPRINGGSIPNAVQIAEELDAEIYPIRGNHVSICHSQVTKYVTQRGGIMIPFGLDCIESIIEISKEARTIPSDLLTNGSLVISCGSGVTLAGILKGLKTPPKQVYGISSGRAVKNILKCINSHVNEIPDNVIIVPASMPYYEIPSIECPFPTDPNYDLKAWKFLVENIAELTDPILFWNIGS